MKQEGFLVRTSFTGRTVFSKQAPRPGQAKRTARILRDCLPSAAVLLALLSFTLWYSHVLAGQAERWAGQLDSVERYARLGDWDAARSALEESRADWAAARPYLQSGSRHDIVDAADALYGRCTALAETEDNLLPDLEELRRALAGLADMERLCLRNIL